MTVDAVAFNRLSFSDIDEFKGIVTNLDVRPVQLERGNLHMDLSEIVFEDLIVRKFFTNRNMMEDAIIPTGWTNFTLTPYQNGAKALWCGMESYTNGMIVARSRREHHSFIPGNWGFLELAVKDEVLIDRGMITEQHLEKCMVPEHGLLRPSAHASKALIQYVHAALSEQSELNLNNNKAMQLLRREILYLLGNALDESLANGGDQPGPRVSRRYLLLRGAESIINEGHWEQLSIDRLAAELNTTTRTLQRAFQQHYALNPYQYLLRRRLQAARQLLKQSSPNSVSIGELAHRLGFSNSSHFSDHFKREFDELPSEFMRRYWSAAL